MGSDRNKRPTPEQLRKRGETRPAPEVFIKSKPFTDRVKRSPFLTWQQKKTICGQAWNGDLLGAIQGFEKLMGKRE